MIGRDNRKDEAHLSLSSPERNELPSLPTGTGCAGAAGGTFEAICSTLGPGFAGCIEIPLHRALGILKLGECLLTPQRAKDRLPRALQNICALDRAGTRQPEVEAKEGAGEGSGTEEDGVNALHWPGQGTRQGAVFPEKGMHAEVTWTRLGG